MKALQLAVFLTAYDKMTKTVDKAVTASEKRLEGMRNKSKDLFMKAGYQAALGAAIAAPFVLATQSAIKFEDQMADVAKVMNITVGSGDFIKAGNQAKDLAMYLGETPEAAAGLMASLAQGGVIAADMKKVATVAGEVGIAFGMTADIAGEKFIKMQNALGSSFDGTKNVMDAINHLSDNTAAKAEQILTFMGSGGAAVANTMKIAGDEMAAFGSTLISMGKSGDEAGTIMQRFQKGIMNNEGLRGMFNQAGGGSAGMMAILEKGSKLQGNAQFQFFAQFGEYGPAIAQMAQNLDKTQATLGLVGDKSKYAGSVSKEFANRQSTTAGQIKKLQAGLQILMVDIGSMFLPLLNKIVKAITPLVAGLMEWIRANPQMVKTIMAVVGTVAGIMLVVSAFNAIKAAIIGINVVMATNPILLAVMAIAAIAVVIIMNWSKVKAWFVSLFQWFKKNWDLVLMWVLPFIGIPIYIIKNWDKVKAWFSSLWTKVVEIFGKIVGFVTNMHTKMFDAGKNIVKSLWEGIKNMASKPVEAIQGIVKKMRDYLPFSPAKVGPLRDIHRIKLVETIAAGIKPGPALSAMAKTSQAIAGYSGARGSGQVSAQTAGGTTVQFNVNFNGPASKEGADMFMSQLRKYAPEISRMIDDVNRRRDRSKF